MTRLTITNKHNTKFVLDFECMDDVIDFIINYTAREDELVSLFVELIKEN